MSCLPSNNRSPGYIYVEYEHTSQSLAHRVRIRLHYGVDPADTLAAATAANQWANLLQDCVTNDFRFVAWGTLDAQKNPVASGAFAAPYVGTHVAAAGAQDYRSATVTITGRGQSLNVGECTGEARMVLFTGRTYLFLPGQKNIPAGVDTALDALRDFLDNHGYLWSDFYGHFAGARGRYPVQKNAAIQRRHGE